MGLACKITGHKWDGCTCARCGEHRDTGVAEDHNYVLVPGTTCEYECTKCGKHTMGHSWYQDLGCTCTVCGATREVSVAFHEWDGCTCKLCGKTRDEGHRLEERALGSIDSHRHRIKCKACGKELRASHNFVRVEGCCCLRCEACGFEKTHHEFVDGSCSGCGIDESDYYGELIASGEVNYYDIESQRGLIYVKYGDHVKSAAARAKLAIALITSGRMGQHIVVPTQTLIEKLGEMAAGDSADPETAAANRGLWEIAMEEEMGVDWRRDACDRICDTALREEAAESIRLWRVAHPRTQADIDYENAMIASDSGLYTTG